MRTMHFLGLGLALAAGACAAGVCEASAREYIKGERPQMRAYSSAVITDGGKIVWLAGQTAGTDENGKSLGDDFDAQARRVFKLLEATIAKAGGKLSDMVQ